MRRVLILGASGNIASRVVTNLTSADDMILTLFVRNPKSLRPVGANTQVTEGNALNYQQVSDAVAGQDIVYGSLAGDLGAMAHNIVRAMDEKGVKRLVFISSIGIYDKPLPPILIPYKEAADVIEASNLDYTIIRPSWFTDTDEVDFEITHKGEPERGSVVSRKSLAALITKIIVSPDLYVRESIGVNKPNS